MTTIARLSGPSALLATIPDLIGGQPTESLVLVAQDGQRGAFAARVDLDHVVANFAGLLRQFADHGADRAVAVTYTDREPLTLLPEFVATALHAAGIGLLDHLLVTGGRWTSLCCNNPACCPPEGQPAP